MDGASLSATPNSRQKRVMPSRSRRGGPGLGHCEVDNLILETQRRKLENEPLIPGGTPFLLTTNPKYAQETLDGSELGIQINIVANERYFDRPDVLKAFRQQTIIQTPKYDAISDSMSGVGGRFRPRNQEEAVAETSDAAYEKRHRKFENFEKRQRLREKEKLKHEHYKLKERIEQLRGMDGAAFMTLSASSFSPAPPEGEEDEEASNNPFAAMNGGIYHAEGERRRKEMLDIAFKLEQRYTYLLPPERPRKPQEVPSREAESRDDSEDEQDSVIGTRRDNSLKQRMHSAKSSASNSSAPSPAPLRPVVPRKSLAMSPIEPRQPPYFVRNLQRYNSSASALSTQPVFPSESPPEPSSPSPEIDILKESEIPPLPPPPTYFQPPPPPPLPSQFVWSLRTSMPIVNVAPLPFQQSQGPQILPVENQALHDGVSMESNDMQFSDSRARENTPIQNQPPTHVPIDDGELEKATSESEAIQREELPLPRKKRGRPPKSSTAAAETASTTITAVGGGEPLIIAPEPPVTKARPGRKPKVSVFEDQLPQGEVLSEIRVQQAPLQEANIAGSSNRVLEEQDKQPNNIPQEGPAADQVTESISTRPFKRRRRNKEGPDESAIAGARESSIQASDKGAQVSATATSIRGKTFVTYVDSRTGETVCTPSLLMIASVRTAEKVNVRKARETTSFGVTTPDFAKGQIVDYELQEEILYRNLRDKSPTIGPECGEQLEGERSSATREQEMEDDREVLTGDDRPEQAQEEEDNPEPGDNEQFSTAVDPRGVDTHNAGEVANGMPQPQFSEASRPFEGRFANGPLSPEEINLPSNLHIEAYPGVRPREPSRHIDDDDELLEW